MESPYSTPKSSLQVEDTGAAFDEATYLKKTIFPSYLVLISLYIVSVFFSDEQSSVIYNIAALLSTLFFNAVMLFLLHKMANQVTSSGKIRYFGIWGFVWRALVTLIASMPILAVFIWVSHIDPAAAKTSPIFAALSGVIQVLAAAPVIWVLFSNNRKLQILLLSRYLGRG